VEVGHTWSFLREMGMLGLLERVSMGGNERMREKKERNNLKMKGGMA